MQPTWGGIEAGGTKIVCTVARGPEDILAETRFPTTTPKNAFAKIIQFFEAHHPETLAGIGVASFGPMDLNPDSPTYGLVTTKYKKTGWANTDFIAPLKAAFNVPVAIDTDVNGAAFGEHLWGAAQGLDTFIYLTIGTGIGGGCMANGKLLHGLTHPEMGHIRIPHDWEQDPYPGCCLAHGDCFEGLASGPAIKGRWGQPAEEIPLDHPGWDLEAYYLALGLVNYIFTLSPQRIIIGGGVLHHPPLIEMIRDNIPNLLGGFVQHPALKEDIDSFIVLPGLGDKAGVLGAVGLAMVSQGKNKE